MTPGRVAGAMTAGPVGALTAGLAAARRTESGP